MARPAADGRGRWRRGVLGTVAFLVGLALAWAAIGAVVYSPTYVVRVLAWGESDQRDYLEHFPRRRLTASATPAPYSAARDDADVGAVLAAALDVPDLDEFLTESSTQALIVLEGERVVYERYANGAERGSMLTSFSVAKSFDSVLVGIALDEGFIDSVDDPVTEYLPELRDRDERFGSITIRHLLQMSSGLDYQEFRWALLNGDDPLTTYHPDQRALALGNTAIVRPPGEVFSYNKYHPQLLGMVLERTVGMSVSQWTQTRLWDPLGMEFDGAWALDSEASGFEKMEAGLNARAIDYAKLGSLVLGGGARNGRQIVSSAWIEESTGPDAARDRPERYVDEFGRTVHDDGRGYYAAMWYGFLRDDGPPDVAAIGDRGQFVYVSRTHDVVVVRNGTDFGIDTFAWLDAFQRVAGEL